MAKSNRRKKQDRDKVAGRRSDQERRHAGPSGNGSRPDTSSG
jgi:hypothetical protein